MKKLLSILCVVCMASGNAIFSMDTKADSAPTAKTNDIVAPKPLASESGIPGVEAKRSVITIIFYMDSPCGGTRLLRTPTPTPTVIGLQAKSSGNEFVCP